MTTHKTSTALLILAALLVSSNTGCFWFMSQGPHLGPLAVPIPVSPYFQDNEEDEFWDHERYERAPILGPLTAESPAVALDEPSDDEVMRALERTHPIEGGIPMLHEIQRNNVRIVKCKMADYVDPPRVYPMVGPAQLHHAHYKCTVYYTEVTRVGWPIPYTTVDEDAREVIYIDHDHLHMVGNVDQGQCPQ
jgi:hypothetical protein